MLCARHCGGATFEKMRGAAEQWVSEESVSLLKELSCCGGAFSGEQFWEVKSCWLVLKGKDVVVGISRT